LPARQRHGDHAHQNALDADVERPRRAFAPALVEFAQVFEGAAGSFDGAIQRVGSLRRLGLTLRLA
jgi:hypothetical protein